MRDHPFWLFSLDRYGRPGVPPLCLAVQDRHGADVNLVLFALWLGNDGRRIKGAEAARRIEDEVRDWHERIVRPLRSARRAMKGWAMTDAAGRDALRAEVQRVEIEAERLEQAMLYDLSLSDAASRVWVPDTAAGRPELMAANARLFCRDAEDGAAPDATLARLAALCVG